MVKIAIFVAFLPRVLQKQLILHSGLKAVALNRVGMWIKQPYRLQKKIRKYTTN
jgi:hypothetical protein